MSRIRAISSLGEFHVRNEAIHVDSEEARPPYLYMLTARIISGRAKLNEDGVNTLEPRLEPILLQCDDMSVSLGVCRAYSLQ